MALSGTPAFATDYGVKVAGNLVQATAVGQAVNVAVGKYSEACMNIGGVGDNPACE